MIETKKSLATMAGVEELVFDTLAGAIMASLAVTALLQTRERRFWAFLASLLLQKHVRLTDSLLESGTRYFSEYRYFPQPPGTYRMYRYGMVSM
jgi:tRNA isopentenyl-2-thiomethyl-A-37 hydroxylase MiaE